MIKQPLLLLSSRSWLKRKWFELARDLIAFMKSFLAAIALFLFLTKLDTFVQCQPATLYNGWKPGTCTNNEQQIAIACLNACTQVVEVTASSVYAQCKPQLPSGHQNMIIMAMLTSINVIFLAAVLLKHFSPFPQHSLRIAAVLTALSIVSVGFVLLGTYSFTVNGIQFDCTGDSSELLAPVCSKKHLVQDSPNCVCCDNSPLNCESQCFATVDIEVYLLALMNIAPCAYTLCLLIQYCEKVLPGSLRSYAVIVVSQGIMDFITFVKFIFAAASIVFLAITGFTECTADGYPELSDALVQISCSPTKNVSSLIYALSVGIVGIGLLFMGGTALARSNRMKRDPVMFACFALPMLLITVVFVIGVIAALLTQPLLFPCGVRTGQKQPESLYSPYVSSSTTFVESGLCAQINFTTTSGASVDCKTQCFSKFPRELIFLICSLLSAPAYAAVSIVIAAFRAASSSTPASEMSASLVPNKTAATEETIETTRKVRIQTAVALIIWILIGISASNVMLNSATAFSQP